MSWGDFIEGNCQDESCPGGDYSGATVWGAKVREVVVLGDFLGDSCLVGSCPRGNYSGAIVWVVIVLGNFMGVVVQGEIVIEPFTVIIIKKCS